jgi:hypothetical protein
MKNIILFIAICFGCSMQLKASHLMGGQITAQHIGTDSVLVNLTVYRDTTGVPFASLGNQINVTDSTGFIVWTAYFNFKGYANIGNGVEEYQMEYLLDASTFAILDTDSSGYKFSWSACCRNAAIVNLAVGSGEMYLETAFKNDATVNSTPVFLNQPVTTAQINTPFSYNPLPFDIDGDSLSWYLDVPWSNNGLPCAGYVQPAYAGADSFQIDANTGQITWTPSNMGNYNATVMVDEYRNGVKIGFIRRDMQIIVLDSAAFGIGNKAMVTINGIVVPSQTQLNFVAPADAYFSLAALVNDVDSNELKITVQGEPFINNNNGVANITNGIAASANINWMPLQSHVRESAYLSTIRVFEKNISRGFVKVNDITVSIQVIKGPNKINTIANTISSIQVSPNPANAIAAIAINSADSRKEQLDVFDVFGKKVFTGAVQLKAGSNAFTIGTAGFSNGMYIVKINNATTRLLVQH